jgi:hypothetical protein
MRILNSFLIVKKKDTLINDLINLIFLDLNDFSHNKFDF